MSKILLVEFNEQWHGFVEVLNNMHSKLIAFKEILWMPTSLWLGEKC